MQIMRNIYLLLIIFIAIPCQMIFGAIIRLQTLDSHKMELIEKVAVGTPDERIRAIEECGYSHIIACYYTLIETLTDENKDIRSAVALALGNIGVKESSEHLKKALENEKDENIKINFIRALGMTRDKDYAEYIASFLKSEVEMIRFHATEALIELNNDKTLEAINSALTTEKSDVCRVVMLEASLHFKKSNKEHADLLKDYLTSPDRNVRYNAAIAAERLLLKELHMSVGAALMYENEPMVREKLASAYKRIGIL